ncbi:hypothetical protein ANTHELSMS3_00833 [Antarctobacter heliothermus]|uniref:Uncharacterized protein n=1 Tax=Antarctobacter heliothermus TaxID=74033 RepID=A0A222E043_9RHOB|nr:hypothetical protein [Antarctobacter heliothermus]ASP19550.1 hypothetical protein ANTHELSMS3_00833 [Antarctobacter heliothermus]
MGHPALIAFVVAFVAGPLVVAALLRLSATLPVLVALSLTVIGAAALAVVFQGRSPLTSLIFFWFGWVVAVAVAMVAQALRRRLPGRTTRRLTLLGALLAAPLPWFGLATAQMMD